MASLLPANAGRRVHRGDDVDAPSAPIGPPPPRNCVTRLSWDRDGRWLFISLGDAGGPLQVWAMDTRDAAPALQALTLDDGDRTIEAVTGESDTPDAAALLIRDPDGQHTVAGVVLAEGPRTLPFPRINDLARVDGIADTFDANDFFPQIEPVGPRHSAGREGHGRLARWRIHRLARRRRTSALARGRAR